MNEHLQFDEDFELYALGALDAEERRAFETHLTDCATCKEQLASAQQRVGLLGTTVPQTAPALRVKQSLLERVRQESPARIVVPLTATRPSFWSFCRQPIFAWSCAVVLAVVAMIFANRSVQLQHRLEQMHADMQTQQDAVAKDRRVAALLTSPQTQRVSLKQPSDATLPEGKIYYQPKQGLLFYASNLPAAPADHVYQLWLVPSEGAPISAGIFQAGPKGDAAVILPVLPSGVSAKAFAVTVEPAGGVPQPTGAKILLGLV